MDTSTHVVMGVGLAGLATLDPAIAASPYMQSAIMATTLIASNAPDFDTVLKLRNNATYIRHHRGMTHSLPAVITWPFLITAGMMLFFPAAHMGTIFLWALISVILHVGVDVFNSYGTQALKPFSNRWIAFGVINIFDPFIFGAHAVGILLWILGVSPGPTFLLIYIGLVGYYVLRMKQKNTVVRRARIHHPNATHVFVSPSLHPSRWHLVIRTKTRLYVAESYKRQLTFFESYTFDPIPDDPIMNAARTDKNLAAFLSFSPTYRWEISHTNQGSYEVRFIDLRYRSKGHYPFIAIVHLDDSLQVTTSYTGWIYKEKTLQKKLNFSPEDG
ncbi:metal-dependent hydrolase [Shouchella lonarensis]|uniref:Inner membrane protein n=1 Tax=Shouchella lonarensis TaxID=1464122 RepID=A0A1G6GPG0_9BACI|nr:metal-dependent hydrolase [Shouchella lonarensis]SDB83902.1 inner membrane protein [Shouchella lonarensis]